LHKIAIFHNCVLGAFFAPQKTGLSGAPRSRAPAPAAPWLNPSNPLRSQHPFGVSVIPIKGSHRLRQSRCEKSAANEKMALDIFPAVIYHFTYPVAANPKPDLKHNNRCFMEKMTTITAFSKQEVCQLSGPPPHFW
jgi:hypothetical protein